MKLCCIFNLAAHYREAIYKKIDEFFSPDFYIGDTVGSPMAIMNYNELRGYKKTLFHKKLIKQLYWQKGEFTLVFKKYDAFLITGNPNCVSTWLLLFFAKIFHKKTYLWTHGYYGDEKGVKLLMKNVFFSLSEKVLLYGNYAKEIMLKQGFNSEKLVPIYNSLDYEKQMLVREKLKPSSVYIDHFNNNNPVIIYTGRIQKVKKIDLLLDAVQLLKEQGFEVNLIIVGKETDYFINDKIEKNNLSHNIWLYGACYDEEILGNLFYNAYVCVSPGNIGLTAIHSLMYGTPCITHSTWSNQMPEFEAIEEGLTGSFVKENDVHALADAIQLWCKQSVPERECTRQRAYKKIDSKYNPRYQMSVFRELFV